MNKMIAVVCLAFAFGAGLGVWAGRELFPRRWDQDRYYQQMLEKFDRELGLDAGQRGKVEKILQDRRQKMKALKEESRPRYEQIRSSAQMEIRVLLTPEQRPKFDRMEAEWKERKDRSRWDR